VIPGKISWTVVTLLLWMQEQQPPKPDLSIRHHCETILQALLISNQESGWLQFLVAALNDALL